MVMSAPVNASIDPSLPRPDAPRTRISRALIGALASAPVLLTAAGGCSDDATDVVVVSTYPENGAMAVPSELTGKFVFSDDYLGDLTKLHATLSLEDNSSTTTIPLQLDLLDDLRSVQFKASLTPETRYCLSVDVEAQSEVNVLEDHRRSCFTTGVPCGLTVNVGTDTTIDVIGGLGSFGIAFLNETLELAVTNDLHIAMILQDSKPGLSFPLSFTALLSGWVTDEAGKIVLPDLGITSTIPGCSIDADGRGRCYAAETIIPLSDDGHSNTLTINEASLTWNDSVWVGDQVNFLEFTLSGYATQESVAATLASLDDSYEFLSDYMDYDLDLDGDGVNDAMTVRFTSAPQPLTVEGLACP
jgi:hypothetical protein